MTIQGVGRELAAALVRAWGYKAWLIVGALVVVIFWQNYTPVVSLSYDATITGAKINALESNIEARKGAVVANCDYKCLTTAWVDLRAEEIFKEKEESYKKQARYEALIEANEMLLEI